MMPPKGLPTQAEVLVLAASTLGAVFGPEDLTLRAWEMDARFAMRGYPGHPDTKKVGAYLANRAGPVKLLKAIEKVGVLQYRLTEVGVEMAKRLGEKTKRRAAS